MSRDVAQLIKDALDDDVIYPFFAVEMMFDSGPLRLWTGLGDLQYQGNTFTGTGTLLSVSEISETAELSVRGASLSLSGIPSDILSYALTEDYQGRLCKIYFGLFSKGFLLLETGDFLLAEDGSKIRFENILSDFVNIFTGYMDQMNIEETGETASIELTVENKLIDLERPRVKRYTEKYQKSVFPDDKGFDEVNDLQDKVFVWGP